MPESREQAGWARLVSQATLTVILSCLLALLCSSGDQWDRTVDWPMYGILIGGLLLALLASRRGWMPLPPFTSLVLLWAAVWLVVKLGLLLFMVSNPEILLRELSESLIWLPSLLAWSMLTHANSETVDQPSTTPFLLGLLTLTSLLGGGYLTQQVGWQPAVISSLAQLCLTAYLTGLGMHYFIGRMHRLRFHEGERVALTRMAYQDLLTGLPNRRCLEEELARQTEPGGPAFALLFIDVDSFKLINDTLGHSQGDLLLQTVARTLNAVASAQAFRLSGDEFVVLLPGGARASELAQRLQHDVAERAGQDLGLNVSLSIGISFFPTDGATAQELLRHADSAMYAVKRGGRGQVRPYQAEQDQATERFQYIARAIGQSRQPQLGGFYLLYQPIYDLRTGRIVKAEALLRWEHPELGQLSPAEFVPVAEQAGQIPHLGLWVLAEACREAGHWPPEVRVSVNVSAFQLARSDFAAQVQEVLASTGLSSDALELELTETAQLYGDERAEQNLTALRQLGVHLSIDDFGAGYANLSRLRSLHLSGVKLDRSLTYHLPAGDEFCHLITGAVSALARRYGLDLTAEGLETQEHVDLVYAMGCPLGQGFALSPPLAPGDLRPLLRQPPRGAMTAQPR